jgi:translation initiation factor 3 subunit L
MVHVVESIINRKYGGWFVRNTEHAQRVYDALKASPLPITKATAVPTTAVEEGKSETKLRSGNAPWGGSTRKVEFAA